MAQFPFPVFSPSLPATCFPQQRQSLFWFAVASQRLHRLQSVAEQP